MTDPFTHLRDKLADLPVQPGVYLMKDSGGKIIYIGKAKVLRNRVRTYFALTSSGDPKTEALRSKIADFEFLVTTNEIEALILEANLVKKHKPRYNVNLKDDKRYPFLKITGDDDFPRLVVTRSLHRDNGIYFGPYANVGGMRETYRLITRLFRLRDCKLRIPHPRPNGTYKVCLQYHIKRCDGPCEKLISKEDYAREVDKVVKLLQGRSAALIAQLEIEMKDYAAAKNFEEAARARDQIRAIQAIMQKQKVVADESIDRDIIAFARSAGDVAAVVLQLRDGLLVGRQNFHLKADASDTEADIAVSFFQQYYLSSAMIPEEIYCSYRPEDESLIKSWLSQRRNGRVELAFPQKGEKLRLIEMAEANARLILQELLKQRQERAGELPPAVALLQKELMLAKPPVKMCCFDISNLGTSNPVGSMVFFHNGKPLKRNYRHFQIKTVTGQDDFAMMNEIVTRYFTRVLSGEFEAPDLCIIDGGRGQLNAALAALSELGIEDQQICGLAKRFEEIILPDEKRAVTLPHTSPALKLMQRVRDEAHRFAITYHRSLRNKKTEQSLLDSIPGIGDKRKHELLKSFGSLDALRQADAEAINRVIRNKHLASTIVEYLSRQEA